MISIRIWFDPGLVMYSPCCGEGGNASSGLQEQSQCEDGVLRSSIETKADLSPRSDSSITSSISMLILFFIGRQVLAHLLISSSKKLFTIFVFLFSSLLFSV